MRLVSFIIIGSLISGWALGGVIRDDFEDGNYKGWREIRGTLLGSARASVRVENGVLVMKAIYDPPPLQPGLAFEAEIGLYTGKSTWTDYRFSCRIMHKGGKGAGGPLKILIRSEEPDDQTNICVNIKSDDVFMLREGPEGAEAKAFHTELGEAVFGESVRVSIGKWYRVEAIAEGSIIRWYLDDQLIGNFDTPEPRSGGVAFYAYCAHGWFDDVEIEGPDISVPQKHSLVTSWAYVKTGQ